MPIILFVNKTENLSADLGGVILSDEFKIIRTNQLLLSDEFIAIRNDIDVVFLNEDGDEINSIFKFVPDKYGDSAISTFFIKTIPRAEDGSGVTLTNVKISICCANDLYENQSPSSGQEIVTKRIISMKSNGIMGDGIIDDQQAIYSRVGGGFDDPNNYLDIGEFPPGTGRCIKLKTVIDDPIEFNEICYPKIVIKYETRN